MMIFLSFVACRMSDPTTFVDELRVLAIRSNPAEISLLELTEISSLQIFQPLTFGLQIPSKNPLIFRYGHVQFWRRLSRKRPFSRKSNRLDHTLKMWTHKYKFLCPFHRLLLDLQVTQKRTYNHLVVRKYTFYGNVGHDILEDWKAENIIQIPQRSI